MKTSHKKLYSLVLAVVLVFGIYSQIPKQNASAQFCQSGQTSGNLFGYLITEKMGNIYLSTESWNDDPAGEGHDPTTELFSTSFNRQTNQFNGRGWSPYAGWVDFDTNSSNQIAEFEDIKANQSQWGNLTYTIDLSNLFYATDPGGFVGVGKHQQGTSPDDGGNVFGGYDINFENVSLIEPQCVQFVTLTLDGFTNQVHFDSCPVGGKVWINWASENVNNCVVDSDNWSNAFNAPMSIEENVPNELQNGNSYYYSGFEINTNSPQSNPISIKCLGINGQSETSSAIISCGDNNDDGNDNGNNDDDEIGSITIPTFIEV